MNYVKGKIRLGADHVERSLNIIPLFVPLQGGGSNMWVIDEIHVDLRGEKDPKAAADLLRRNVSLFAGLPGTCTLLESFDDRGAFSSSGFLGGESMTLEHLHNLPEDEKSAGMRWRFDPGFGKPKPEPLTHEAMNKFDELMPGIYLNYDKSVPGVTCTIPKRPASQKKYRAWADEACRRLECMGNDPLLHGFEQKRVSASSLARYKLHGFGSMPDAGALAAILRRLAAVMMGDVDFQAYHAFTFDIVDGMNKGVGEKVCCDLGAEAIRPCAGYLNMLMLKPGDMANLLPRIPGTNMESRRVRVAWADHDGFKGEVARVECSKNHALLDVSLRGTAGVCNRLAADIEQAVGARIEFA